MNTMQWAGVIPAITTSMQADGGVDHAALADHCRWMIDSGCAGIVCCGSLGESATLSFDEKLAIAETCVDAVGQRAPIGLGIAASSTAEAVALARGAAERGCSGLMVLPPYLYSTEWREMKAHVSAVIAATKLSCMLYNNPPAYRTDFLPGEIAELAAEHANLQAVKESSGDVRRVTALKALCGERLALFVGLDDVVVEGVRAGAVGWIGGVTNALPRECTALFHAAVRGEAQKADALYKWLLPLLRMDTVVKFVQYLKLIQQEVGMGDERVRGPRLPLAGAEREDALRIIRSVLAARPRL